MVILRQKEFVSKKMAFKVGVETGKRNIKFLGRLGKLTGKRIKETGDLVMISKGGTAKNIANAVVDDNKRTIKFMKNTAHQLGSKEIPASKKLEIVTELATDLNPKTAVGKHLAAEAYHTTGKTGTDVVRGLSEMATNPAKKTGEILADFRQGGHGGAPLAGKWVGPGVNKWCLGVAPDTVVSSVGEQFERYKGKEALQKEVEELVKSKDGRRFARSYDKVIGKHLNKVHNNIKNVIEKVPSSIDNTSTAIGTIFKRPARPVLVPA